MNTLYLSIISFFVLSIIGCSSNENINEDPIDPSPNDPLPPNLSIACEECNFVVPIGEGKFDGEKEGVQPGDVICLSGALEKYSRITFTNIEGKEGNPILIQNCDGKAIIESNDAFGLKFTHSKHFKVLGNGSDNDTYGIKVSTAKGFFITMELFTTNFEIAYVEVAGFEPNGIGPNNGFAGMGIKTSPYQDCDLFRDPTRTAWIMKDIKVHDNYIHDIGGEGLYIGHGFYTGRKESACDAITYSHSIQGMRIYNNLIENVGNDGIQIKNVDKDCEVYNNTIRNYGVVNEGAHNEGLFIGGGTTGKFYNNYVIGGTGTGIQCQGIGNLDIYNNLVVDSGDYGFFASGGAYITRFPDGYFNIINNTFVNSGNYGFAFFDEGGGVKRLVNNVFAIAESDIFRRGIPLDSVGNRHSQNLNQFGFKSPSNGDFSLQANSILVDKGVDIAAFGITEDIEGNKRPSGNGVDIGAFEFQ